MSVDLTADELRYLLTAIEPMVWAGEAFAQALETKLDLALMETEWAADDADARASGNFV